MVPIRLGGSARLTMTWFASSSACSTASVNSGRSSTQRASASTASLLATSPEPWPPMPSATA